MRKKTKNKSLTLVTKIGEERKKFTGNKARIEEDQYRTKAQRDDQIQKHLNYIVVITMWILFALFVVIFIIRALHFIISDYWQWLEPEQINGIDKLLYSGAIGGLIGRYFKKTLDNDK